MKPLTIFTTIIILSITLLSACAEGSSTNQVQLEGTSWTLVTYNKNRPFAGTQPTIQFEDARVSGIASCNHYGGSYKVKGDTISFGIFEVTEMFCMEPEGAMEQESAYLELLGSAERFEVADGVLTIFSGPQQTLTFEKQ